MDIFKSEKAPYILGLLVTVISWHVSQLVNEITQTRAVSYSVSINPKTHDVVAKIRNVSRTKSLVNAQFQLACEEGSDCLVPIRTPEAGEVPVYGEVRPIPPNFVRARPVGNAARGVSFVSTVAAGGGYDIAARLVGRNSRVQFYFLPDPENPLDIYIYNRNSMLGFLVQNYLLILVISCLACLLLLVIFLGRSIVLSLRPAAPTPALAPEVPAPVPAVSGPAGPALAGPDKKVKPNGI